MTIVYYAESKSKWNVLARIILQAPRRAHASPLLRMLHWLPCPVWVPRL